MAKIKKSTEITLSTLPKVKVTHKDSKVTHKDSPNKKRNAENGDKRLSKIKQKALKEEKEAKELIEKLKKDAENLSDEKDSNLKMYLNMQSQLKKIIAKTEKLCLKSQGAQGVYQLATLYTQLRETIACIQNLTDLTDHAENLIEKVIKPSFTTIVQSYSDSSHIIKLKIKSRLKEKYIKRTFDEIDDITIDGGRQLQECYNKTVKDIRNLLIGDR